MLSHKPVERFGMTSASGRSVSGGANAKGLRRPSKHLPSLARRVARRKRQQQHQRRLGALPSALEHFVANHHLFFGLEPLYMPCSGLRCGDIVYRSTLDPALRLEERGINPYSVALGGLVFTYLFSTPGILPGFLDYYFLAPLSGLLRKKLSSEDIYLGRSLGAGGFGKVYKAKLRQATGEDAEIVVKKAYEYGEAEVWMNERLERVCPSRVPKFIDAFEGPEEKGKGKPLWLVWKFEGEATLADAIMERNFPANLEEKLLGKKLDPTLPTARRQALVIQRIMKEVLSALIDFHSTGIVHRDVKPQNILLSSKGVKGGKVKLIDFGAAADLRIGINYLPKEFLLDPRYAPPEKYIMSTSTPQAPPLPVAAALSPVLWALNRPDRFDMYSVGILLVQMCFPSLRRDNQLVAFNRQLENLDYDILKWRDSIVSKRGGGNMSSGIEILDLDNGRGWDLLRLLINNNPSRRIGATAAASHPFVSKNNLGVVPVLLDQVGEIFPEDVQKESEWLADRMATGAKAGLTEVKVEDVVGTKTMKEKARLQSYENSRTVAWWEGRRAQPTRFFRIWTWKAGKTVSSYSSKLSKQKEKSFLSRLFPSSSGN